MGVSWQAYTDPQSGQQFPVWEGHYTYPGTGLTFIPTYSGGMFEGLMPNEVVPETSWGTHSFGLADTRTADVQIRYAIQQLRSPVWGMSPSSTPDDTGNYAGYGVEGLEFPYYGTGADAPIRTWGCPSATAARRRTSSRRMRRSLPWMSPRSRPTPTSRRCRLLSRRVRR